MTTQSATQTPRWTFDPAHSSAEFSVKHMVISTVRGRFSKVDVDIDFDEQQPERSHLATTIDVASIDTRESKRDDHLRSADFFDAANFPRITFESTRVTRTGDGRYALEGNLTIKGITRPVTLDAELTGFGKDPWGNRRAGFSATTRVNRKDFGLTWNVALETGGLLVGEEVRISIDGELVNAAV
ncbi:MAG: polyisoprenoid-binding protein [Chloroflexi bacterium]|nr:polyisoprenoid-binding protein [Chloroflexota bacterium]